jgi:hypothetical protein
VFGFLLRACITRVPLSGVDGNRVRRSRELCAGKGFLFAAIGDVALRGFEDPVRLYEVQWRDEA